MRGDKSGSRQKEEREQKEALQEELLSEAFNACMEEQLSFIPPEMCIRDRGMKKATDAAVDAIAKMSSKVSGKHQIARVAAVSSGDEEVGNMVADAMEKVSNDGVITIEESKTMKTELDLVEGMQFDRGYISAYMATDMEKMLSLIHI